MLDEVVSKSATVHVLISPSPCPSRRAPTSTQRKEITHPFPVHSIRTPPSPPAMTSLRPPPGPRPPSSQRPDPSCKEPRCPTDRQGTQPRELSSMECRLLIGQPLADRPADYFWPAQPRLRLCCANRHPARKSRCNVIDSAENFLMGCRHRFLCSGVVFQRKWCGARCHSRHTGPAPETAGHC